MFNFSHEAANGRTSSIAQDDSKLLSLRSAFQTHSYSFCDLSFLEEIMGFSPTGEQAGCEGLSPGQQVQARQAEEPVKAKPQVLIDRMGTSTASSRNQTWQQVGDI